MQNFESWPKNWYIQLFFEFMRGCVGTTGQDHSLVFDSGLSKYDNFKHLLRSHGTNSNYINGGHASRSKSR